MTSSFSINVAEMFCNFVVHKPLEFGLEALCPTTVIRCDKPLIL